MAQRRLVTLTVRDYATATPAFQSALSRQDEVVERCWCSSDLDERALAAHPMKPPQTRRDVEDRLHESGVRSSGEDDVLVLVITGHGRLGASRRHYLELPQTDRAGLLTTAYPTSEIVTAALGSAARHVLVIVNCCYSGVIRGEIESMLDDMPIPRQQLRTLAVFSVGATNERPGVPRLTTLLERTDRSLRTSAGYVDPHLTVEQFERELVEAARVDADAPEPLRLWPRNLPDATTLCLPNPGYVERDQVVRRGLRDVAVGRAELDAWVERDPGRCPTGRSVGIALNDFLRDGDGLLAVTGAAGSGKTTALAWAVTLSQPLVRDDPRYRDALAAAPEGALPPERSVDAAVSARGKDSLTIGSDLLAALGVRPVLRPGVDVLDAIRSRLTEEVASRERVTIVLDGLDEAEDPVTVITDCIAPLLDVTGPVVRVIVGVRSPSTPVDALGLVDLLERVGGSGFRSVRTEDLDVGSVHNLLAGWSGALRSDGAAEDAASEDVVVGLLRAALTREARDAADREHLVAALRATAFGEGRGIPWAGVWPAMAESVHGGDIPDVDGVIARVLGGRLGRFLARDDEDGVVVHRPVHGLVARILRDDAGRLEGP